jgi:hypothetical protein
MRSLAAVVLVACQAHAPAPVADLVSPLAPNADLAMLAKFDWKRETAVSPAEKVFANVLVQQGMTAERFMIGMLAMKTSLGVACTHCHDHTAFPSDELPPKRMARRMLLMADRLNRETWGSETRVACYTCHRGEAKPPPPPAPPAPPAALALTDDEANKPARDVWKNIQVLGSKRAKLVPVLMATYSAALGVPCTHCHVDGAWERDDVPAKARARQMIQLTGRANAEIYGTTDGIGCFTCHRGSPAPPPMTP